MGVAGRSMCWNPGLNEKEKGKLQRTLVEFLAFPTGEGSHQPPLILALGDLTEASVLLYSILIPTPSYTVYVKL